MTGRALLAALVLAVALPAASGDDDARAPVDVSGEAKVGDWLAFQTTIVEDLARYRHTELVEVSAVTTESVSLRALSTGEVTTHPRHLAPRLLDLLQGPRKGSIAGVKTSDEKRAVAGRELDCQRVDFEVGGKEPIAVSMWFSAAVPVHGLVAMKARGAKKENEALAVEVRLLGCGTKDATLLGVERAEAEKALAREGR